MKKHMGKIIATLIGVILPIYVYAIFTNLFWPDLAWGARQWHQILGSEMISVVVCLFFGIIIDLEP